MNAEPRACRQTIVSQSEGLKAGFHGLACIMRDWEVFAGIVPAMIEAIQRDVVAVKRRAMACLGELIFFAAAESKVGMSVLPLREKTFLRE